MAPADKEIEQVNNAGKVVYGPHNLAALRCSVNTGRRVSCALPCLCPDTRLCRYVHPGALVFLYVDSALLHRTVVGEQLALISAVKAKRRFLRVGRGTTRAAVLEESQFFWSRPRHKMTPWRGSRVLL